MQTDKRTSHENTTSESVESRLGSLPVPFSERTWHPWLAAAICATAAIATWSFVVGGGTAFYVGAREGTATLFAGALVAQLLVSLAQVPPTTIYGLETVVTTKPQLGVRGSYVALLLHYAILIGWNLVLMIFFGRAVASLLQAANLIGEGQRGSVSMITSVIGVALVWLLLGRGSRGLKYVGPIVAVTVVIIGIWMFVVLLRNFGLSELVAADPLAPIEGGRLTNYTIAFEYMLVASLGWWAYMGGILRMVSSPGKAIPPSMFSMGAGWAAIALIALYASLVTGESDPTIWMLDLGGPVAGVAILIFIAFANIGSGVVGTHAATLGLGQVPVISNRIKSWRAKVAIALAPMVLILLLFPDPFYDNVGIFLAFVGIAIAPMVGVQIVDWYIFGRIRSLHVPSLYRHDQRSQYWYFRGFNVAGLIALLAGVVVFASLLDPITYEPRSAVYPYVTATLPAVFAGGLTYWIGFRITKKLCTGKQGDETVERPVDETVERPVDETVERPVVD